MTARSCDPAFRSANASLAVTRGFRHIRSRSASLVVNGARMTVNVSTLRNDTTASFTLALIPCTSETTAMIEATATMLPSTVMNDRSLLAQIAFKAIEIASTNWVMASSGRRGRAAGRWGTRYTARGCRGEK
jgi:hypothetical protein